MNRYRITEHYCERVWYEKIVDINAETAEQAIDIFHEEIEGEVTLVSEEEIESEYDYSSVQDILEISC